MSSTEIEDVLSSIRRLVSEELRPMVRTRPAANAAAAAALVAPAPAPPAAPPVGSGPAEAGKLILTPALRIVARPLAETPVAAPAPMPAAAPPVPNEAAAPLPVFIATRRVNLAARPEAPAGAFAAEAPFTLAEPAPIEQVVASLGAAVTAQPGEWEPEQGDAPMTGLAGAGWAMPPASFDQEEDDGEAAPPMPAGAAAPQPDEADVPAWAQHDVAGPTIAEAASEPLHGTVEPDAAWADAAEASIIASLQAEAEAAAQAPEAAERAGDPTEDEMRFNEDVLRELVRDILREELAGSMGVRITRNIRKLVRAEIATILATQELE